MNKYNFIFAILVFVFVACSPSEAKLPQENPTIIFNTEKKEFLQDNNNMISFTINNPSELYLSCTVTIFFETENGATKELCVVTLDSTKKAIKSNTQLEFEYVNNREKIKTTNFYFSIKEEGLLKFCVNVGMDDINVVNSQEYKITPNIDPLVTDIFFSLAHNDEGEIIDDVYCVNYSAKDEDGNIVSSYVKSIYYVNENGEEKELIIDDNENFNLVYSGKYKVVIAIKDNSSNFFSLFTSFVNFDKNIFPEIYLSGESIANINEEIKVVLNISDNDQSSKFFNVEVKLGYDNKQIYKENFINGQQIILSFSKASANVFPSNSSILNYISSEYSKYAENPYYDVSNLDVDSIDNDLEDVFPVIFYVTDESENTTAQLYFCNIYDYKFVGAIYNNNRLEAEAAILDSVNFGVLRNNRIDENTIKHIRFFAAKYTDNITTFNKIYLKDLNNNDILLANSGCFFDTVFQFTNSNLLNFNEEIIIYGELEYKNLQGFEIVPLSKKILVEK